MTEFGYQRDEAKLEIAFACLRALIVCGAHSVRIMGSGVLDLCFVACGRLDAVYAGVAGKCRWYVLCELMQCMHGWQVNVGVDVLSQSIIPFI